jgi:hypothetical protein
VRPARGKYENTIHYRPGTSGQDSDYSAELLRRLECNVAVARHRPDRGGHRRRFSFIHSLALRGGSISRKLRQIPPLHRQARTFGALVMAKKHQHTDDLIDALVWMRRHESSPISVAKNNTQVDTDAIARLTISVVKRLHQSVILRRKVVHIGEWTPTVNRCHDNVAVWVAKKQRHKHVRGFIYMDLRPMAQRARLLAHSAVETEDGTLCDITPHEASIDYPFIRHLGTDEEFELFGRVGYFDLAVKKAAKRERIKKPKLK